jgi:hypothetical protein
MPETRTRRRPEPTGLEIEVERAILQLIRQSDYRDCCREVGDIVKQLRGAATPAATRAAVDRLHDEGQIILQADDGRVLCCLPDGFYMERRCQRARR